MITYNKDNDIRKSACNSRLTAEKFFEYARNSAEYDLNKAYSAVSDLLKQEKIIKGE